MSSSASSVAPTGTPHYYVPAPSSHPVMASIGLFFCHFGCQPVDQWCSLGRVFAGFWHGDVARNAFCLVPRVRP